MKKIFICLTLLATSASAGQQDMLSNMPLPLTNPKAVYMRPDVNMGQLIHAFDDGESEPGDTVLRRSWSADSSIAVRLNKNVGTLISRPEGEKIQGYILGDPIGFGSKLLVNDMPNKICYHAKGI